MCPLHAWPEVTAQVLPPATSVLGLTLDTGKTGESDPDPYLEEAPGWWESQRRIGCLPGHRVGFITASDGHSSRLKPSSSLTRLLISDMFLCLSVPHLPPKRNEDSVSGSSCGHQEHSASGHQANIRLSPAPQEQRSPRFGLFRSIAQSSKPRRQKHNDLAKPKELLRDQPAWKPGPQLWSSIRVGTCLPALFLKLHAQAKK